MSNAFRIKVDDVFRVTRRWVMTGVVMDGNAHAPRRGELRSPKGSVPITIEAFEINRKFYSKAPEGARLATVATVKDSAPIADGFRREGLLGPIEVIDLEIVIPETPWWRLWR